MYNDLPAQLSDQLVGLLTKSVRPGTDKPYILSATGGTDNSHEGSEVSVFLFKHDSCACATQSPPLRVQGLNRRADMVSSMALRMVS